MITEPDGGARVSVPPIDPGDPQGREVDTRSDGADTDPLPALSSFPGFDWNTVSTENRPVEWVAAAADPFAFPAVTSGRVRRRRKALAIAGAAVAATVLLAGGVIVWLTGTDTEGQPASGAASTTASATRDRAAEAKLRTLLPAGYGADSCRPADLTNGALAVVDCGTNTDAGGPPTATYALFGDRQTLITAFEAVVDATRVVTCPGNLQSPGPWRRNATPQQVSGTLFCGFEQQRPTLAWTDEERSLLSTVRSGPQGPDLSQLYAWWSMHS